MIGPRLGLQGASGEPCGACTECGININGSGPGNDDDLLAKAGLVRLSFIDNQLDLVGARLAVRIGWRIVKVRGGCGCV